MITLKTVPIASLRSSDIPWAVFAYEDGAIAGAASLPARVKKELLERAKAESFKAKASECVSLPSSDGTRQRRFVLVGLGKRKELSSEGLRRAAGSLGQYCRKRFKSVAVFPCGDVQALAEGLLLSSYRFDEYRKPDPDSIWTEARLAQESSAARTLEGALKRASLFCEAVALARDLVNRGPSDKRPEAMGSVAHSLAKSRVSVKIIDRDEAEKMGMGSYLSVARGSSVPPCFVHLVYKPKGAKRKIALVGKGITFDSGGLSLKPPQAMEDMKMDMAGAALVLGVFRVLERLGVKAEVHGVCAFTYNMPGPDATKPGDIVRAMNGKTIEVLNTDAEGRLVLADALVYAGRQGVDTMLNFATLTGAALIALGSKVTAVMTNDRPLLAKIQKASEKSGEAVWELPLVAEYAERIKSSIADLRNISKVRTEAGTIIGGLFLQEFVDGKPWMHFDIAGPAWTTGDPYCPEGGTGAMIRTVLEYLTAL